MPAHDPNPARHPQKIEAARRRAPPPAGEVAAGELRRYLRLIADMIE